MNWFDVKIFIIVRDLVSCLKQQIEWLEQAGYTNLTLINNASTYEPLLQYLSESPHKIIHCEVNHGNKVPWILGVPGEQFVASDPDIIPIEDCPYTLVERLSEVLQQYPSYTKAGPGLYLDDLPPGMPSLEHERRLMARGIGAGVFDSQIDTTFALYRPGSPFTLRAIRTGYPYMARHTRWHEPEINDELRFYLDHAMGGTNGSSWKSDLDAGSPAMPS